MLTRILVYSTTLGQSVYPDIALHISNYYISSLSDTVNQEILVQGNKIFTTFYHLINIINMTACPFTLCRGFFTPKIGPVPPKLQGPFYKQGYKVKEKTAIIPHCTPSFKTQWAPCMTQSVKLNRDIHFTCILHLLNNTCVKHYFKSVHVSNLF